MSRQLSKEEILEIVRARKWSIQGFNGTPLYLITAASDSGWLVADVLEKGYTHFFYFFSDGQASMYYDEQDWENICEAYYKKVTSREQLEALIRDYKKQYVDLVQATIYDSSSLPELSSSDLVSLMKKLCNRLRDAVGFAHAIEGITFGSEKKLREVLVRQGGASEQEFGLTCSPVHPSFLLAAQQELWRIRKLEGVAQEKAIDDFIREYGWIENTYLGAKRFSRQDVRSRAGALKEEPVFDEEIANQKKEIFQRFQLSAAEQFIIETIELCFHWQDERKKNILQTIGALEPVVRALAERFEIEPTTLKVMTTQEITEEYLADPAFHEQLRKRRENSVYYSVPGKNYIFTNADYDFFSRELHVAFDDGNKELKGVVASPGVVQGVVKVCESVSDIDKVQLGEILVASMTRPEYLPAMQKAAAFITDEGGVTSHAAIISRELKKPCIIGTKIATKVLKDGMRVEVDATKGIVRVLE